MRLQLPGIRLDCNLEMVTRDQVCLRADVFRLLRERGGPAAREESCLIIGPWSHTQHDASLGEWGFGQTSSLASSGVGTAHLAFFKRHLMDGEAVPLPTVRYFQTGSNRWRESTDVADTDFMVKLCDVDLEGHSCNVADGFLRMRWRNGESGPEFVVPGQVTEIEIGLGLTGHVFDSGHCLRLQVTSSAFPYIDRNMNTGERVGSDSQGRPARQMVYHSKHYPSQLILPVLGE